MTTLPETKYAKSGDYHIAYQVIGTGPLDLVFMHRWISHIEHMRKCLAWRGSWTASRPSVA